MNFKGKICLYETSCVVGQIDNITTTAIRYRLESDLFDKCSKNHKRSVFEKVTGVFAIPLKQL